MYTCYDQRKKRVTTAYTAHDRNSPVKMNNFIEQVAEQPKILSASVDFAALKFRDYDLHLKVDESNRKNVEGNENIASIANSIKAATNTITANNTNNKTVSRGTTLRELDNCLRGIQICSLN